MVWWSDRPRRGMPTYLSRYLHAQVYVGSLIRYLDLQGRLLVFLGRLGHCNV